MYPFNKRHCSDDPAKGERKKKIVGFGKIVGLGKSAE